MDLTKFWTDNKKLIITTATAVAVALLVLKFFDFIVLGVVLVALGVAVVLFANHLKTKHGGTDGVWKALLKELGLK